MLIYYILLFYHFLFLIILCSLELFLIYFLANFKFLFYVIKRLTILQFYLDLIETQYP